MFKIVKHDPKTIHKKQFRFSHQKSPISEEATVTRLASALMLTRNNFQAKFMLFSMGTSDGYACFFFRQPIWGRKIPLFHV